VIIIAIILSIASQLSYLLAHIYTTGNKQLDDIIQLHVYTVIISGASGRFLLVTIFFMFLYYNRTYLGLFCTSISLSASEFPIPNPKEVCLDQLTVTNRLPKQAGWHVTPVCHVTCSRHAEPRGVVLSSAAYTRIRAASSRRQRTSA